MHGIYKNIEKFNPDKRRKILIVFDHLIADMLSNIITHENSKLTRTSTNSIYLFIRY